MLAREVKAPGSVRDRPRCLGSDRKSRQPGVTNISRLQLPASFLHSPTLSQSILANFNQPTTLTMADLPGIPPLETSPDKVLPLPKPSTPPSRPSFQTLQSWAPLYLKKTDLTISHLSKILSTPSGTDTVLLTICYTSLLTSSVLSSISLARIHRLALETIEKAISLPPNTTVIIDTHNSRIPTSRLLVTAQRLKALSSLISDFRIFVRLWGLLGIWNWGKAVMNTPPKDLFIRRIAQLQVLVNVFYQYLENYAYLSSKGVLGWSPEKQNKAWIWSSRFWMAHVGLDFLRLAREYAVREERGTDDERRKDGGHGAVRTDRGEREWWTKWRREMLVNGAWAPLTLHWSLEKGILGDFGVGVFGSVAGVVRFRELWKNTCEA
jgi:hypothetical protein